MFDAPSEEIGHLSENHDAESDNDNMVKEIDYNVTKVVYRS